MRNTDTVGVVPGTIVKNYSLSASCARPAKNTETVGFGVISVLAEPVCGFTDASAPVNPGGIRVGDTATFRVEVSPGVPDGEIHWSCGGGIATFGGNGTAEGRTVQVTGAQEGAGELRVSIDHFYGPDVTFRLAVYGASPAPIPVRVGIICDSNNVPCTTLERADRMLVLANALFRQAGICFSRVSVTNIINESWLNATNTPLQDQIRNVMTGTGGLEVYFTSTLDAKNEVYGNNNRYGLIVANSAPDHVLAHELGHACGWPDLYILHGNQPAITGFTSEARLPGDWNNGPGQTEYYGHSQTQALLLPRLLMYGLDIQGVPKGYDISSGSVYGIYTFSTEASSPTPGVTDTGLAPCGLDSINRTPQHE